MTYDVPRGQCRGSYCARLSWSEPARSNNDASTGICNRRYLPSGRVIPLEWATLAQNLVDIPVPWMMALYSSFEGYRILHPDGVDRVAYQMSALILPCGDAAIVNKRSEDELER